MPTRTISLLPLLLAIGIPEAHSFVARPISPIKDVISSLQLSTPTRPYSTAAASKRLVIMTRSSSLLANSGKNGDSNDDDFEQTQREIDAMMRQQDEAARQSTTLFGGLDTNTMNDDSDDGEGYNAVPLFTGSIVLLASLFFTGYGFFVFFTGEDPIFLNQPPTAPPPDSWYESYSK